MKIAFVFLTLVCFVNSFADFDKPAQTVDWVKYSLWMDGISNDSQVSVSATSEPQLKEELQKALELIE